MIILTPPQKYFICAVVGYFAALVTCGWAFKRLLKYYTDAIYENYCEALERLKQKYEVKK